MTSDVWGARHGRDWWGRPKAGKLEEAAASGTCGGDVSCNAVH